MSRKRWWIVAAAALVAAFAAGALVLSLLAALGRSALGPAREAHDAVAEELARARRQIDALAAPRLVAAGLAIERQEEGSVITGTVKNATAFPANQVRLELALWDGGGRRLGATAVEAVEVGGGGRWDFRIAVPDPEVRQVTVERLTWQPGVASPGGGG